MTLYRSTTGVWLSFLHIGKSTKKCYVNLIRYKKALANRLWIVNPKTSNKS
ncbi:hypothetical protein CMALT394_110032 [Carnobacterium maltaromaticum]|nr:hypothetical protein CMALT394_110032 [Carnobacterium maltaromaticum]